MRMAVRLLVLASAWTVGVCHAQDPAKPAGAAAAEADALDLADKAQEAPAEAQRPPLRAFVELAAGRGNAVEPGSTDMASMGRMALDLRWAARPDPRFGVVLSTRLDLVRGQGSLYEGTANTLREAHLAWNDGPALAVEVGRINIRHGVAMGFNPTDWFKQSSVRSILNLDPAVLRENRQGTVALQGHRFWDNGSLTMAWSPRISGGSDRGVLALHPQATNPDDRWLLAGSYKLAPGLSPQLLLHGGASLPTQVGLNITTLLNDAAVVYAELGTGRDLSLVQRVQQPGASKAWQNRLATGLTYTAPFDLTVTTELQHNSAAPRQAEWQALPASVRAQLLDDTTTRQDLPARWQLFLHALWKLPVLRPLELQGFYQRDGETRSHAAWLEARYRLQQMEFALQVQAFGGATGSIYGSVPQPRAWQLVWRHYL